MDSTPALPWRPDAMSAAQLAAVSYPARYSGHTRTLYAYQLRRWFTWCETHSLDPLTGIQRAHVQLLYIRHLSDTGPADSSVVTMLHTVRGFFRFAHIDGAIASDPAVYARLPKVHRDESRTNGLDRLELSRFLQVARTITVHHGALTYLLGINALRASGAAAVRIEDYQDTLRGHRVLVGAPQLGDPRIRLRPQRVKGRTVIPLTRQADGMQAWKIVIPCTKTTPEVRSHAGREWLYVLSGRMRLVVGDRDVVLGPGEVADFDTASPHWFGSTGDGPAEVLSLFGRHGERLHLRSGPSSPPVAT